MKMKQTLCAALAAVLLLAGTLPLTVKDVSGTSIDTADAGESTNAPEDINPADGQMPGTSDTAPANGQTPGAPDTLPADGQAPDTSDSTPADGQTPGTPDGTPADGQTPGTPDTLPTDEQTPGTSDTAPAGGQTPGAPDTSPADGQTPGTSDSTPAGGQAPENPDTPPADGQTPENPAFSSRVEWSPGNGYLVMGTFTEFTSDMVCVQPMYSLDGEAYLPASLDMCWDLQWYGSQDEGKLKKLQNQICLYSNMEPLKSYLAGDLDRFYLKLRITMENGKSCETQAALIDRGSPQPLPEGITASACFDSSMSVRETIPPRRRYGRYQLTVSEDATPEEIAKYLPETLPIVVKLTNGTEGAVDCPVTWKPLSLPSLTPGECVSIEDAAQAITVPAGTLLYTPLGIFRLDEAVGFDRVYFSDKINLVLNVVANDAAPSGVLTEDRDGLELAFYLKPTGAAAIRAYVCKEGDTQWSELPGLPFLDAVNAQPSTESSGYTLVLGNDVEPYRSYLAQKDSGNFTPFFVGLNIEGGAYDGRQLILAWPFNYDLPLDLPKLAGSGGNENNAGSDNKNDSTDEGQRPNLPGNSSNPPESQPPTSDPGVQEDPETPDIPKPGQSGTQTPDTQTPGQSDPQAPDTQTPEQSDPQAPDTQTPGIFKPVLPRPQSPGQNQNLAADAKTDIAKNFTADEKSEASAKKPSNKKDRESHSQAFTDLPSDGQLHNNKSMPPTQAKTNPPDTRTSSEMPKRNQSSDGHSPLLPLMAAAALLGICIAAARAKTS